MDAQTTTASLRKMPVDLMRKVKSEAALRGQTIAEFAIEAFEKALGAKNGANGAKK